MQTTSEPYAHLRGADSETIDLEATRFLAFHAYLDRRLSLEDLEAAAEAGHRAPWLLEQMSEYVEWLHNPREGA